MTSVFIKLSILILLLTAGTGSARAQFGSQDPGHKEYAEVGGIRFSVPKHFGRMKTSQNKVAFMRHEKYDLGLFISALDTEVDDAYLTALSDELVAQLSPRDKDFQWKVLRLDSNEKVSKFQTSTGAMKGFNARKFFQVHYKTGKVKNREILIGYITKLGDDAAQAKFLFNLESTGGMSMPGWYAQAHIMASITGETYEEINPGTVIKGTLIPQAN